jgi:hypothetical protein
VIVPVFRLDSREAWRPVAVEASLGAYGYEWDGGWKRDGVTVDHIDFPKSMTPDDVAGPAIGYRRVVDGGGLWWRQFWLWWPMNPKTYAGIGAHEGDYEMVQLGCRDPEGNVPILMTLSQHDGGAKREFWSVELDGGQPVVYVARDSHANYPTPTRDVTDQADGKGERIEIEWRDFGAWAEWPGKWGNSENSPGPLSTRRAWQAPHAYHSQARG